MSRHLLVFVAILLVGAGCGKSVELGPQPARQGPGDLPKGPVSAAEGPRSPCAPKQWKFNQPAEAKERAVDLLFVVDTSRSLGPKRARIARELPRFLGALSPATDLRVGVMLAHGGASPWSGKLYAPAGTAPVLSLKDSGQEKAQNSLSAILSSLPADADEGNGEMLLYSLSRALLADRLSESRKAGFFRSGASLAIVFITDENDGCFDPLAAGYSTYPDFVRDPFGWEDRARERYCTGADPSGVGYVDPQGVVASLHSTFPNQPLSIGAIVHVDANEMPSYANGREDAIGHGIIETALSTPDHVLLDIARTDGWSDGLAELGSVVAKQPQLRTRFKLSGGTAPELGSLRVTVDGHASAFSYDPAKRAVTIQASEAGKAGSLVVVDGCVKDQASSNLN